MPWKWRCKSHLSARPGACASVSPAGSRGSIKTAAAAESSKESATPGATKTTVEGRHAHRLHCRRSDECRDLPLLEPKTANMQVPTSSTCCRWSTKRPVLQPDTYATAQSDAGKRLLCSTSTPSICAAFGSPGRFSLSPRNSGCTLGPCRGRAKCLKRLKRLIGILASPLACWCDVHGNNALWALLTPALGNFPQHSALMSDQLATNVDASVDGVTGVLVDPLRWNQDQQHRRPTMANARSLFPLRSSEVLDYGNTRGPAHYLLHSVMMPLNFAKRHCSPCGPPKRPFHRDWDCRLSQQQSLTRTRGGS